MLQGSVLTIDITHHFSVSEVFRRREWLETKLKQLDTLNPDVGCSVSSSLFPEYSTSMEARHVDDLHQRRPSINSKVEPKLPYQDSDLANIATAATVEPGSPLNVDQIRCSQDAVRDEIQSLNDELSGKSLSSKNRYPHNLTLRDFAEYIPMPSVVYQLEYPRQDHINWFYVGERIIATFGVLGVMHVVSQAYIYPVVIACVEITEKGVPLQQRLRELPGVFSDLLFPLMMEYMLSWYVIRECIVSVCCRIGTLRYSLMISRRPRPHLFLYQMLCRPVNLLNEFILQLNVLAELTCFADRGFSADWWNAVSWDQFSRDWNRPVYAFLLRHVYHPLISSLRLSRSTAMLATFFLSACVHELVMLCLFKKLRGYLMVAQMSQLPMVAVSKMRCMRGRKVLGNLLFWIGIFTGPSILCSLYLLI